MITWFIAPLGFNMDDSILHKHTHLYSIVHVQGMAVRYFECFDEICSHFDMLDKLICMCKRE